jgi:hypothetical protein
VGKSRSVFGRFKGIYTITIVGITSNGTVVYKQAEINKNEFLIYTCVRPNQYVAIT